MSTPAPAEPTASKINKTELLSDVLAFASIVSAFLFLSHTLHNQYLQALGLPLSSASDIALLYLLYALLIVLLKSTAALVRWRKGETDFSREVESALNRSLFAVTVIAAVYLPALPKEGEVGVLCKIVAWLLVAQVNTIFCTLLGRVSPAFRSLALFGTTIEIVLVLGQLASFIGLDFFQVL